MGGAGARVDTTPPTGHSAATGGVMVKLSENIRSRVRKLPKPADVAQSMQPLFEAVSNAFYALDDGFGEQNASNGTIIIEINYIGNKDKMTIIVRDNGIGMDHLRYEAFCQVDTEFKFAKGGKGVGRLFWLDAFLNIEVESRYFVDANLKSLRFDFVLSNDDQIIPKDAAPIFIPADERGTAVFLRGLRGAEYQKYFPKQKNNFKKHFTSHFLPRFLRDNCPKIHLSVNGEVSIYPQAVSDLIIKKFDAMDIKLSDDYGVFKIEPFLMNDSVSTGLGGQHFAHFLAHNRTVESRKIDGLLAVKNIQFEGQEHLVLHVLVSATFLDIRVNEGRTAFTFSEDILQDITKKCAEQLRLKVIADEVSKYEQARRSSFENFIARHPIYAFDDVDTQLSRLPQNADDPEAFASGLVKHQIRREEARHKELEGILLELEKADIAEDIKETLATRIESAAQSIQRSELLALANHVVRRRLLLEIIEKLINRVRRIGEGENDHHLESTLHSFLCPMRIRGDDPSIEARAHDLWIIDERLAFTRAFSSDERLDKILAEGNADRTDLLVWDVAFGMGEIRANEKGDEVEVDTSEPLRRVLIVEFKKPGRKNYSKTEDFIESQINKYIGALKGGSIEGFNNQRIRISNDCIFNCYVVADLVGGLSEQLRGWRDTANGRGKVRVLDGEFRGTIEVMQWQDLINDAWERNKSAIVAAGLPYAKGR